MEADKSASHISWTVPSSTTRSLIRSPENLHVSTLLGSGRGLELASGGASFLKRLLARMVPAVLGVRELGVSLNESVCLASAIARAALYFAAASIKAWVVDWLLLVTSSCPAEEAAPSFNPSAAHDFQAMLHRPKAGCCILWESEPTGRSFR